jgi:hypothetical protein
LDTHIEDLLAFFQNVNKLRRLFISRKPKQMINKTRKGKPLLTGTRPFDLLTFPFDLLTF